MSDLPYDINPITLDMVKLPWFRNAPLKRVRVPNINGLDIETLDGYAKVLADHTGKYVEPESLDDIIEFMTQRRFRHASNFFYNIRFDYQSILKYLDKDDLLGLYNGGTLDYEGVRVFYIPRKLLSFTKNNNSFRYFDLAQFYEMSLEKASNKFLGMVKNEDNLDRALIGTSAKYWEDHYDEIVKYCIQDCKLAEQLGLLLRDTMINKVKMVPQAYISKAGLSKAYFRMNCDFPHVRDIPLPVVGIFLNAYSGGRFEVIRKGFIPNCYAVDINSAYSKAITLLPDLRGGKWEKVEKWTGKALIGCYLCKITSDVRSLGPHRFRIRPNLIGYPIGSYYTYLTNWEVESLQEDVKITIVRGWEYYDSNPRYPFKEAIEKLYGLKSSTEKKHYEYDLYKKIMNSLYGSFYEKTETEKGLKGGKLFNPVYASLITAYCRMQIWKVIRDYEDYVIGIATDGIILDKKPKLPYSKKLGDWSMEGSGDAVIVRSGLYRIDDKIKARGIRSFEGIKSPERKYEDIFEYIEDKPKLTAYTILDHRPLNLGECLVHTKKKSIQDLNNFIDTEYTININKDFKRVWDGEFKNGGELLEKEIGSKPLMIGV